MASQIKSDKVTIYACDKDLETVKRKLENNSKVAIQWFKQNYMKLNSDKCKVLICGRTNQPITIKIGDFNIKEDDCVKLLGVYIDKKLNFDKHVSKSPLPHAQTRC